MLDFSAPLTPVYEISEGAQSLSAQNALKHIAKQPHLAMPHRLSPNTLQLLYRKKRDQPTTDNEMDIDDTNSDNNEFIKPKKT